MGYHNDNLERLARPHWYVAFCNGQEIGSSPTVEEAKRIVFMHMRTQDPPRPQRTQHALVWDVPARRYMVRKLKHARPAPGYDLPQRVRRHG